MLLATMAEYKQRNIQTINRAFARLLANEERAILDGMERLANAGIEYLIEAHNLHAMFMNHTQEDNTIGWALAHNGKVLKSRRYDGGGGDLPGEAEEKARRIAEKTSGWTVIILSDMDGWYRQDLEIEFLTDAAFGITQDFNKFFKKVN